MLRPTWRQFLWASLLVTLAASAPVAQILNSERIEQTFGSYGIDVLYSDATLRLSSLYSVHDGEKVTRTFAVVRYPEMVDPAISGEHEAILAGGSIGATFQAAGFEVIKRNIAWIEDDARADAGRLMGIEPQTTLAIHVYGFDVVRDGHRFVYATIAEMHHPDYLGIGDLRAIYPSESEADLRVTGDALALIMAGRRKLALLDLSLSE